MKRNTTELLGRGKKKKKEVQQGIILAMCVCHPTLPHTHTTTMLVTILKSTAYFQLYFDALCGSVYLMSCAKNSLFFLLFFLFKKTCHIHG